jgi:hypothetical protein
MASKYAKWPQNMPNSHKIYIPTSSIARPSKIYPDWDFWLENMSSGNPGRKVSENSSPLNLYTRACELRQWMAQRNGF